MKKLLSVLFLMLTPVIARAHSVISDASNITRGTLDPRRVSPTTFTMLGSDFLNAVQGSTAAQNSSFAAFGATVTTFINLLLTTDATVAQRIDGLQTTVSTISDVLAELVIATTALDNLPDPVRLYKVVVGTTGTPGIDAIVTNTNQFNLVLASVGAMGITDASTSPAQIYFRDGIYSLTGTTVPKGIEIIGGSSSVWIDGGATTAQLLNLYGKVKSIKFDLAGLTFAAPKIQLRSYSILEDCEFYGANAASNVIGSNVIHIKNAQGVKGTKLVIKDASSGSAGTVNYGVASPLYVTNSSTVSLQFDLWDARNIASGGDRAMGAVVVSTNILIYDSKITNLIQDGIFFYGGTVNSGVRNSDFHTQNFVGSRGVLIFSQNDTTLKHGVSSSCFSDSNRFFLVGAGSNVQIIDIAGTGGIQPTSYSTRIIGNTAVASGAVADPAFIIVAAGAFNTEVINNSSFGLDTFLTDTGKGTVKSGNFKDGIAQ